VIVLVFGAIDEKGDKYYTYLREVFDALGDEQKNYNWLVTDSELYPKLPEAKKLYTQSFDLLGPKGVRKRFPAPEFCFLSGEELTEIVHKENIQWIWAVLSGFDKSIPREEILRYPLPWADGYTGFWKNPLSLQHPLAEIEIVPWDASLTLVLSKRRELVERFLQAMPGSRDLAQYNEED
jgi:hypothetical protein